MCTGDAPKTPNDIDNVQTNVQYSTSPDLTGALTVVGYRQTYSQVRVCLGCPLLLPIMLKGRLYFSQEM